ncbi:MAG: low molecular weight phosphotyrosine protein phosphatase [Phycisphaera sp.]|nr:low molecular weight phosphotyrosine protein phosphatase [Phycisphaera sp.]
MSDSNTVSVLFVCMGNICRSPTGEGVMKRLVAERGHAGRVAVDSAGTISYHEGNPADARMRRAAANRGYDLTSIARQIKPRDLATFDLIVAMDSDNLDNIRRLDRDNVFGDRIRLLSAFLPDGSGFGVDVPDPYYGGDAGFEHVIDMIEAACPTILEHLLTLADAKSNA